MAHTRWRWPPDGGPFVDLKQNFLLYITRNTSLSAVKAALDHRLRVSATATTQTRRRRPCGQTVAVGYTTFRRSRVVLEDQQSGAQLDEAALQGLVARAAPLPARDGVPGRLAVHVNSPRCTWRRLVRRRRRRGPRRRPVKGTNPSPLLLSKGVPTAPLAQKLHLRRARHRRGDGARRAPLPRIAVNN